MVETNRFAPSLASRREFLWNCGGGFAGLALSDLLARDGLATEAPKPALNGGVHHPAKVRRVIQLFMNGGASHLDLFDYRPGLVKKHGVGGLMKSPFEFRQHGQSGKWISSVLPHTAKFVDDLAFLMAMHTDNNVHGNSSYAMNTGFARAGFPCLGAWISYGLGRLSDNFPAFVVLPDTVGMPYNGEGNFTAGFLSAQHAGTIVRVGSRPIADLSPPPKFRFATPDADRDGLALLQQLNADHKTRDPADSRLDARIQSYQLAARMQSSAPEAFDLNQETEATKNMYGLGQGAPDDFGRRCLMARRLVERGVRFVQVWSGHDGASNNWDNHGDILNGVAAQAAKIDRPVAALIADLKRRGLFEDTLLVWATEFGRTAIGQGGKGRDHNGSCFNVWFAGAGIRAGVAHGSSDETGAKAAEGRTDPHDFHATILHLLGIDHTRLTFLHNGVNRRLTDVHGDVVREILT